jgi:hypothetical protein
LVECADATALETSDATMNGGPNRSIDLVARVRDASCDPNYRERLLEAIAAQTVSKDAAGARTGPSALIGKACIRFPRLDG